MVFPLLLIVAGAGDVMTLRIPNRLVMCVALAFFVFAPASGMSLELMSVHLATGGVLLATGLLLFSLNLFGGGDAKLLAAAGLWLGFPGALMLVAFTALAGGVLAVALAMVFMTHLQADLRSRKLGKRFEGLAPKLPYGFAIAVGAISALPWSWWILFAT